jgi:hypothetical protein
MVRSFFEVVLSRAGVYRSVPRVTHLPCVSPPSRLIDAGYLTRNAPERNGVRTHVRCSEIQFTRVSERPGGGDRRLVAGIFHAIFRG